MSDVDRLQDRFAEIIASDHRHGGQLDIEQRAAALADEALNLQNAGSATQRVRSNLYASAAAFRSSAMWAAIDGRRFNDAVGAHARGADPRRDVRRPGHQVPHLEPRGQPCTGTWAAQPMP